MKYTVTLSLLAATLLTNPTWAMTQKKEMKSKHDHSMCQHSMMDMAYKGVDYPAGKLLDMANKTMHKGMDITYSGNVDIDFLKGMIAHHQGAVDMAQALLKGDSQDHRVKTMARNIIRAQELEIAWMKKWLAQNEAKAKGYQDKAWEGSDDMLNQLK